jgi:hypothetical protein
MSPGSIKILAQLKIPLMAVMSMVILGRKYGALEWLAIGIVMMSVRKENH